MFKTNKKIEEMQTEIDDLKKSVSQSKSSNADLKDEILKLKRIIKRSKDVPTYHFYTDIWSSYNREYGIYVYIDKEEYFVKLDEIKSHCIDSNSFEFYVKNDLAYFNVSTYFGTLRDWKRWKFIIDYHNGKYVVACEEDKDRNSKEIEKVTIE